MSDDKKVIFSMVKVNKTTPTGKHILKDIYLSFYYAFVYYALKSITQILQKHRGPTIHKQNITPH